MTKFTAAVAFAAALAASPTVAGHWNMSVSSPHGAMVMPLVIEQTGDHVAATLSTPHGDDMHLDGEFAHDTLTLSTRSDGDESHQTTITGTLKPNGSLEGFLSSPMGDMSWTAERAKDK